MPPINGQISLPTVDGAALENDTISTYTSSFDLFQITDTLSSPDKRWPNNVAYAEDEDMHLPFVVDL